MRNVLRLRVLALVFAFFILLSDAYSATAIGPGTNVTLTTGRNYQIVKKAGNGAFGMAYFVTSSEHPSQRRVLKLYDPSSLSEEDIKETSAFLYKLNQKHPSGVIDVYNWGDTNIDGSKYWYILMAEGDGTLDEHKEMFRFGEDPVVNNRILRTAVRVTHQGLRTIQDLEKLGYVHNDIKPTNLMLTLEGDLKLIDFEAVSKLKSKVTFIYGTPEFIAPERYRGESPNGRSDLYSFGMTMLQLMAGTTGTTLPHRTDGSIDDARLARDSNDTTSYFARYDVIIRWRDSVLLHIADPKDRTVFRELVAQLLAWTHPQPERRSMTATIARDYEIRYQSADIPTTKSKPLLAPGACQSVTRRLTSSSQ